MPSRKRVMRFIGNRSVPEPDLYAKDPIEFIMGIDWGQDIPKSMSFEDLREFSKTCPNPLTSDFPAPDGTNLPGQLLIKSLRTDDLLDNLTYQLFQMLTRSVHSVFPFYGDTVDDGSKLEEQPPELVDKEPFEMNLAEPLMGWRKWLYSQPLGSAAFALRSMNGTYAWKPCQAFTARCNVHSEQWGAPMKHAHKKSLVPFDGCTCGIYAVDKIDNLPDRENTQIVMGRVYGWGRYIRGNDGWRAQYAYPAEFRLRSYQQHLIEPLKEFRVPIFIDDPLQIYNPEDDGYGNWAQETHRDFGAAPEPGATED
jgi:hypothetical protein